MGESLTKEQDRLPAQSGIAKRAQKRLIADMLPVYGLMIWQVSSAGLWTGYWLLALGQDVQGQQVTALERLLRGCCSLKPCNFTEVPA
jgi:hypothetical protein